MSCSDAVPGQAIVGVDGETYEDTMTVAATMTYYMWYGGGVCYDPNGEGFACGCANDECVPNLEVVGTFMIPLPSESGEGEEGGDRRALNSNANGFGIKRIEKSPSTQRKLGAKASAKAKEAASATFRAAEAKMLKNSGMTKHEAKLKLKKSSRTNGARPEDAMP
jgi:hypothetical protein